MQVYWVNFFLKLFFLKLFFKEKLFSKKSREKMFNASKKFERKKVCKNGINCWYQANGTCHFYHPPAIKFAKVSRETKVARVEKKEKEEKYSRQEIENLWITIRKREQLKVEKYKYLNLLPEQLFIFCLCTKLTFKDIISLMNTCSTFSKRIKKGLLPSSVTNSSLGSDFSMKIYQFEINNHISSRPLRQRSAPQVKEKDRMIYSHQVPWYIKSLEVSGRNKPYNDLPSYGPYNSSDHKQFKERQIYYLSLNNKKRGQLTLNNLHYVETLILSDFHPADFLDDPENFLDDKREPVVMNDLKKISLMKRLRTVKIAMKDLFLMKQSMLSFINAALTKSSSVKNLSIEYSTTNPEQMYSWVCNVDNFFHSNKLETLELCGNLIMVADPSLLKMMTNLTALSIKECDNLDQTTLHKICQSLPSSVKKLSFKFADQKERKQESKRLTLQSYRPSLEFLQGIGVESVDTFRDHHRQ